MECSDLKRHTTIPFKGNLCKEWVCAKTNRMFFQTGDGVLEECPFVSHKVIIWRWFLRMPSIDAWPMPGAPARFPKQSYWPRMGTRVACPLRDRIDSVQTTKLGNDRDIWLVIVCKHSKSTSRHRSVRLWVCTFSVQHDSTQLDCGSELQIVFSGLSPLHSRY